MKRVLRTGGITDRNAEAVLSNLFFHVLSAFIKVINEITGISTAVGIHTNPGFEPTETGVKVIASAGARIS